MKKYNDEALCPEKFQQMAKEYLQNKKQLIIKKIEENSIVKNNLINQIKNNTLYILNSIETLTNYNLSNKNKNYLYRLKHYTDSIKKIVPFEQIQLQTKVFCHHLKQTICLCTKTIKQIIKLEKFCTEDKFVYYLNIQKNLLCLIENLACMFGECKYRKI